MRMSEDGGRVDTPSRLLPRPVAHGAVRRRVRAIWRCGMLLLLVGNGCVAPVPTPSAGRAAATPQAKSAPPAEVSFYKPDPPQPSFFKPDPGPAAAASRPSPAAGITPVPPPSSPPPATAWGGGARLTLEMLTTNNSRPDGVWRKTSRLRPGDVVEVLLRISNDGAERANSVQVWGAVEGRVPQDPSLRHHFTGKTAEPALGDPIYDTAYVEIEGGRPVGMRYYPGRGRVVGVTSLYNCPSGCFVRDDSSPLGGMLLGDLEPGAAVALSYLASAVAMGDAPPGP